MKRLSKWIPVLALGLLCASAGPAQQAPQQSAQPAAVPAAAAGGGLDAVTPFINQNTDLVVAIDLSNVNVDQLRTWMENQMQKAGVDKATMEKMQEEAKPEMDKTAQKLAQFKEAGGRRIYIVGSLQEMMTTGPLTVVPVEGQADGQALAKVFEAEMAGAAGAAEEGGDKPVAAMAGRNLLIGSQQAVTAARTPQPAARPEIMQALGANATLKVALSWANLAKQGNVAGMPLPPEAQGIEWISFNVNAPPAVGASLTIQAQDAETAKKVAEGFNQLLAMMQQHPQAQQALGDNAAALTKALTPTVNNRRVIVALNTRTIEDTLMPMAIKAAVAERAKKQAEQQPGQGDGAAPEPGLP